MPDPDVNEQTIPEETAQDAASPEQPQAAAEEAPVADAEPTGEAADATPDEPTEPSLADLLADETRIDQVVDQFPALKKRLLDGQNQAVQRRESELRRQAGTRESVARLTDQAIRYLDDHPEQARKDLGFVADLALGHATDASLRTIAKLALDHYEVPSEQRGLVEKAINTVTDANDLASYAWSVIDAAVQANTAKAKTALEADIDKRVAAKVKAELAAKRLEGQPKNPTLPAAPKGVSTGGLGHALEHMSDEQFSRLPPTERQRLLQEADAAERVAVR